MWTGLPGTAVISTSVEMATVWQIMIRQPYGAELCPLTAAVFIIGILILMDIGTGVVLYPVPVLSVTTLELLLILPTAAN